MMVKNLEQKIVHFVETWGPDPKLYPTLRAAFIEKLRALMNDYARAALEHGNLPEVGSPHIERRKPQ